VLFEVHEVLKQLRSRKIVLYSDVTTMMTEEVLPANLVIRPQQASEQFKVTVASSLGQRDAPLRLDSSTKFPSYKDVFSKVEIAENKRKEKEKADMEAAAAGRLGADEEEEDAVAVGGRRRALTVGFGEENEKKSKKVAPKSGPTKPRAASGGARGTTAAIASTASAARSTHSARSAKNHETPAKGSSAGSVLRAAVDGGSTKKKGKACEAATDYPGDEALTFRNVYTSCDIDEILRGSKLDRSTRGVPFSI
jgi:hypothetical protein